VWADWASPYITLQPEYEAAQLRVFGKMFLNGHIYRCVWGGAGGLAACCMVVCT
jgi:isoleucyl-tRNA synthetase